MVVAAVEARQLSLPSPTLSFPPPQVVSLLYDPVSLSLALLHSDSSVSLYHSLSPLSLSSPTLPPPQTLIPAPNSSVTFLHLRPSHSSSFDNPVSLFLVSSPISGGSAVLFRFYMFNSGLKAFTRAMVVSNNRELNFDRGRFGIVFRVSHGVSMKLAGSVNVFALYSVSNAKIWVFSVKLLQDDKLKLMKSAVIDCCKLVFSFSVSFGFLILGEENGVRIFPLRPLVKGRLQKEGKKEMNGDNAEGKTIRRDGLMQSINGIDVEDNAFDGNGNAHLDGRLHEKSNKLLDIVKSRSVKLRQDSRDGGSYFMEFVYDVFESSEVSKAGAKSIRSISIEALCSDKFMILDSAGNLHILFLTSSSHGLGIASQMKQLTQVMKIQKLAVFPGSEIVWISDGDHTVHLMVVSDLDTSVGGSDEKDSAEKHMQASVAQALFTSEKVQDMIPLAANSLLLLGQGSMYAYGVS